MAVVEAYAGSETVGGTEWSLTTDTSGPDVATAPGEYQLFLDLNAVAAGDVFELKVYEKVLSSSTQRLGISTRFSGVQGGPVWISPVYMLLNGWDMTLKKISGTDRAIDWSIRSTSDAAATVSLAAIKAKTDSLAFTVAGQVDANIQYVNDVQVTGNGSAGTPWGP